MKKTFAFIVLVVLMCSLGNRALAQNRAIMKPVTETIDFSNYGGSGRPNVGLSFDSNNHPQIDGNVVSERFTVQNASNSVWGFWGSDTYNETYLQLQPNQGTQNATLSNLKAGDVVTIWGECGDEDGDFNISGSVEPKNTTYYEYAGKTYPNSKEYLITNSGDVQVQCHGNYSGIRKITIQSQERETPHFDYDPGYEEYDMYDEFSENDPKKEQTSNNETWGQPYTSYSLSTEATGITLNGNSAQYIVLSDSKITANNRIAIDDQAGTWRFNYGLRAPNNGKWANFSICNLREGDRVIISYTGTAPVFSSVAGGTTAPTGPYNGSNAFFDKYNDGQYDEGEDTYITPGAQVLQDWSRGEGNIWGEDNGGRNNDNNTPLIYTRYVITEDGHLDLAIAPDTRIVKIKIYSDHQAMMVDKPGREEFSNMSYFNITGELQANEHIVPGGLEVHVGSDDASQHAHVVSSLEGPVSIINGVDGFKLPGMSGSVDNLQFEFDLANNVPTTGTFYKFMPLESGKMTVRFQAASMNYYRYDLRGDEVYYGSTGSYTENNWQATNDRPNEQTVDVSCPYYVKVSTNDGYEDVEEIIWNGASSGSGGSSEPTEQDLWTNVNDGSVLSLSVIENAGGTDDDIITFYLSVNGGNSSEGWGMGGLTSSSGSHDPRNNNGYEFIRQGNSWTQTYTLAELKTLANGSGGVWVALWNNAVLPRVTLTTSGGASGPKNLGNGEVIEFEINVEAGKTYYLYGGWNVNATDLYFYGSGEDTNQQPTNNIEYFPYGNGNNGGTMKACGVAKLLWVEYSPYNIITPLAKWVPNNTPGVYKDNTGEYGVPNPDDPSYESDKLEYELADIKGYIGAQVTVKKVSGNIRSCTPFIWRADPNAIEGKLMIKNITFVDGKDKGGTILIKIGDPSVRSNPVYTLTIAYSTDPQYDGKTGTGPRGHTWDYSSNSLNGLKWNAPYTPYGAQPADYGHYFDNYFAEDISQYSSKDEVWAALQPENGSGLLYEEIISGNSDWMFNYNLVNGGLLYDPVFTNKYDMEGDNADMIWETEGTVIKASANSSVMFNEFKGTDIHQSTKDPDRYVGIREGGEFRIPWLRKNDRVIIYMGVGKGAFNDEAVFSIKNAYDAVHNVIDPDDEYVIGGSKWNYSSTTIEATEEGQDPLTIVNDDRYYRGCYHFFATGDQNNEEKPADMVFKMTRGNLCKIYSIQIYRGDRIITNEVVGETADDKFLLWSRAKDPNDPNDEAEMGPTYNWTLKYFGKDQKLANGKKADGTTGGVNNDIVAWTGTGISTKTLTTSDDNTFTFTHDYQTIGTFRARGKDMEKNMKYVADYGEHNVTVAHQQTMEYPYTWDLMDMTGWGSNATRFINEDAYGSLAYKTKSEWFDNDDLWNASYEKSSTDLSLFGTAVGNENGYVLRLNTQETASKYPQDNIFESAQTLENNEPYYGNQFWTDGRIVPESQGLWFHTPNQNTISGSMRIYNDGMTVGGNPNWRYNMVVPNVPKDAAVYMRIKVAGDYCEQKYRFAGSETSSDFTLMPTEMDDEYIVAIKNNNSEKKHLTLSFVGYQLKKLAVSTDPKAVDSKGWATESRDHIIDTKLLPYLTGLPIKTYFVGVPNYEERTLTLTEVSDDENTDEFVMPASTGCLLYNENKGKADIFGTDTGFHLFVPDMHDGTLLADATATTTGGAKVNMLKEQLTQRNPSTWDDANPVPAEETVNGVSYTNYVLSYKYYVYNSEGYNNTEPVETDVDMFYRVANTGIGLRANSAYLQLPTDIVKPQGASGAKYTFVFAGYDDIFGGDFDGVATGIEGATANSQNEKNVWYNLNGQKLNGVPTTGGIYILNGKKVFVK